MSRLRYRHGEATGGMNRLGRADIFGVPRRLAPVSHSGPPNRRIARGRAAGDGGDFHPMWRSCRSFRSRHELCEDAHRGGERANFTLIDRSAGSAR